MELQELRDKLGIYVLEADERKLNALYTLLERDIESEYNLWEDREFVTELNERVRKYQSGEEKGYTEEEAMARFKVGIEQRKLAHV